MKDYFRRAPYRQAIIENAHPALSSVAGTTSEIRSQRIQGGLISKDQRISTWPKKKKVLSSTTQIRPSGETQICVEITFYVWYCPEQRLELLHSAAHAFLPRTVPSIKDFIEEDLLPALDLSICRFQRQDGDQLRLATSIKKKQPILLSYDNTSRQDTKDIMKRFTGKGNEYLINVIIIRTEQETATSAKHKAPRRAKKSHQVGIQIKREERGDQGEPVEEDHDLDDDLLDPSVLFNFRPLPRLPSRGVSDLLARVS